MVDVVDYLKRVFIFSQLSQNDLEELAKISSVETYKKNGILFYEGDPSEKIHILVDGIVKAYKTDMKENEIVLHYFYPTFHPRIVSYSAS